MKLTDVFKEIFLFLKLEIFFIWSLTLEKYAFENIFSIKSEVIIIEIFRSKLY